MSNDKVSGEANKAQSAGLAGVCSRLAGDDLCRCGSSMKGRYCLWSHYPPPLRFDEKNDKGDLWKEIWR